MSDLIDRQAAIDALNTLFKKQVTQFGYEGYEKADEKTQLVCDGISYSIGCVLNLPSAQPQWIPVTERLPERGKDVLVTRDYDGRADHIKSCRYVEVASCYGEDDDVSWNSYSDEYKMTPKNHRVVAWMPLPDPWKGE